MLLLSYADTRSVCIAWDTAPQQTMHALNWLPSDVQVASALAARHIGGAVNYVGVAETLSIGASAQAAGLAADSLICALYFAGLFKLASRIGPDPVSTQAAATGEGTGEAASEGQATSGIQVSTKRSCKFCLLFCLITFMQLLVRLMSKLGALILPYKGMAWCQVQALSQSNFTEHSQSNFPANKVESLML